MRPGKQICLDDRAKPEPERVPLWPPPWFPPQWDLGFTGCEASGAPDLPAGRWQ